MTKKFRIVNSKGGTVFYQGTPLVFDPREPQVQGMTERERAETLLWLLGESCDEHLRLEEFEE